MYNLVYVFIICITWTFTSAQVPAPVNTQENPILIKGATAHLGNGKVIENSLIGFSNGRLTIVSDISENPSTAGYQIIEAGGKHVYPGFILPNSQLGLVEVSSVKAMRDNQERGAINPNVRSVISYNTDSEMIPTMRFNGILLAESTPAGGAISGCSSVMEMEGWNWEDACHTMDIGMHMNWPARMRRQFDFSTFSVNVTPNKNYAKDVENLKKHFSDAVAFHNQETKERNLKMEAMGGLFDGKMRLFIHTNSAKEMIEAIRFAEDAGVKNLILVGGTDALYIADFLKEHQIPVILPPTHSLPPRADADVDLPYKLPYLLTKAGVEVSLSHSGMLANARNLAFYAGTAAAYGMEKEEALKTITLNPARALGINDRVGSLEVGKDATLFISKGDALDVRGNILTHAFISGKMITLPNKQQELYLRYSKKYGHSE